MARGHRIGQALATAATCCLVLVGLGGCASSDSTAAGAAFDPATPETLTVATAVLPAPGFWVEAQGGRYTGFEGDLARLLAERFDLELEVVQVPFADLVEGDLGGADLAISQLTATDDRREVLDFSTPYLAATPTVLARSGVEGRDLAAIVGLRWVALESSTLTPVLEDRIRPDDAPRLVDSRAEQLDALRRGDADAALLDLPVALALARSEPGEFTVLGQLSGDEGLSVALPKGSDDVEAVDAAIRQLTADGTIPDLSDRWFDTRADDVPLIRVKE